MPGIGGLSIANNLLANSASLNLNNNQDRLHNIVTQLSSGLRVNTAADDPSGLAIAESIQAQVNGFDAAVRNVQDANNASQVAEGALQTTTDILQRIRSLAVQASSDLTSAADKVNLQVEVTQLLLEVNRISQNTQFNGQALLDGSHAGFQGQVLATFSVTSNSALATSGGSSGTSFLSAVGAGGANTGFLVATITSSLIGTGFNTTFGGVQSGNLSGSTVDGTIELQVINTGSSIAVLETFINSSTGVVSQGVQLLSSLTAYSANAGTTFTFDNVGLALGAFTTADVGVTAFIKISQFTASQSNPSKPAFNFQSGSNEGATIQVGFQSTNTSTLRISNINLLLSSSAGPSLGAEDAIGQIDNALQSLLQQRANFGAVIVRLNEDAANDNIASVNLQASESGIRDLNVGQATTQFTRLQILVQVGTSVLAQSNSNAQSVLGLFR